MSLKVELTIEKTNLAFDEDTRFVVTVTNKSREAVTALHPGDCWTLPAIRIVNLRLGIDRTLRREPNLFIEEFPVTIDPGASLSGTHSLLAFAKFEEPGEYDVSALWEWNGGQGSAASDPVRVVIRAVRPRRPHTVSVTGGPSAIFSSVWIDAGPQPPQLCRSRIEMINAPAVVAIQSLGAITPDTQPVLSVPVNGGASDRQWIAWFQGDELRFSRVDDSTERLEYQTLALSPVPKQIVPPLNHGDGAAGADGRFFLWQGNVEGTVSRFQSVRIDPRKGAEPGPHVMLGRLRPRWMEATFFSSGAARTCFVLPAQTAAFHLHTVEWSAEGEPEDVVRVAQFEGEFHGAAIALAEDDMLHGALLVLEPGPDADRELGLYCWQQDPAGTFTAGDIVLVPREPLQKIDRAVVGVSAQGEPALLIRYKGASWQFYDEQHGLVPLPPEIAENDLPLELLFLVSGIPVIKYVVDNKGFYFLSASGMPVSTPAHG